jgi:hypothetical protein
MTASHRTAPARPAPGERSLCACISPPETSHSSRKRPDICVAPQRDGALVYQASRLAERDIASHPLWWCDSQTTPWRDPL